MFVGSRATDLLGWLGIVAFCASSTVALGLVAWRLAGPPTTGTTVISALAATLCFGLFRTLHRRRIAVAVLRTVAACVAALTIVFALGYHPWLACGTAAGLVLSTGWTTELSSSQTSMLRFALQSSGAALATMLALDTSISLLAVAIIGGAAAGLFMLARVSPREPH